MKALEARVREQEGEYDAARAGATPPQPSTVYRLAARTWWMPWLIGAAVVVVAAVTAVQILTGSSPAAQQTEGHTRHQVVYEVTGAVHVPEIRYVIDGVQGVETVTRAELPWRVELGVEVGPGLGVVQVMATRSDGTSPISCSVRIDGTVVHRADAMPGWSSVSCSAVIRPDKG